MTRSFLPRLSLPAALLLAAALTGAMAAILLWMGRVAICPCGFIKVWHSHPNDAGTSQHLTDWYTYSHVLHGLIFYWLLWAVFRGRLSVAARLVIAVLIEGAWEVIENSSFIIERYRAQTVARDYAGDSVINSIGDMLATVAGFLLSARLPVWISVLLFGAIELVLLYAIRDNLLLNILMLIYPLDWVRQWQAGG
jgi:hypothetical protein